MKEALFVAAVLVCLQACLGASGVYQPVTGTFLDVQWMDQRFKYMNEYAKNYTCDDWKLKMKEMKEFGLDTLIFQTVADDDKSYYISKLRPSFPLGCSDVVEAVMSAGDELGIGIWLTMEYVHNMWDSITDPKVMEGRLAIMRELAQTYVPRHKSFVGWYISEEACIMPYYSNDFLNYMKVLTKEARSLTPNAKIIISPYGTRFAIADQKYIDQLKSLNIDVVAYQDEVGCVRDNDPIWSSKKAFANLKKAHDAAGVELWANIESFTWEGAPNSQQSALIPAAFPRLLAQNEAVGSLVKKIISFTWQGMYDPPGSKAPWGHVAAKRLHNDYTSWRRGDHDKLLLAEAVHGHVSHAAIGASYKLVTAPSPKYNGGNLTDGVTGDQQMVYENHLWLGFDKVDFDMTLTLAHETSINEIALIMLQSTPLAIYLPNTVTFSVSLDGKSFDTVKTMQTDFWEQEKYDNRFELYHAQLATPKTARFVRIFAVNQVPSSTAKAWLFASEVMINPSF
eukprot:TRINITY_DN243_c0_g1_i1.p1 TRINITY_DN243_c0_g1~~TRINITY_DN243_c0_g1_i1.p1  ORF type:complete len:509 (+),score=144.13 TRINITY_DN243_c0_g1_i1:74-1600(+)